MNFNMAGNRFLFLFFFASICYLSMANCKKIINFSIGSNDLKQNVDIAANSSIVIQAIDIPQEISSVLFQAHTQRVNLTLSQHEIPSLHYSVNGTNVGLVSELQGDDPVAKMWVYNYSDKNSTLLIIIIPFNESDPVPGGCNMEFPVSTSPFLRLSFGKMKVVLEYEHANIGTSRNDKPPSCSQAINVLSYHIYVYFLQESNYGQLEYFSGIEKMSNASFVKKFGKKVNAFEVHPATRATFYGYSSIGTVYNVVARYYKKGVLYEAAYVPSVTYGCELVSEDYGCFSSGIPRPVFLLMSLLAGFQVFFGHRFFNSGVFFFGFVAFGFIGYILFQKFSTLSETNSYILSALVGAFSGIFWVFVWNLLGRPVLSLILVGLVLGFLLSATAMYTPLGNLEVFNNDRNYWLTLCCGTLLVTVVSLPFCVTLSIIASSVVGSFASIVAFEQDRNGSLPYILINVVRRAVNSELSIAYNEYPFKNKEIISSCAWVVISITGIVVQFYLARGRPSFPEPCRCYCCRMRVLKCTCRDIPAHVTERQMSYNDVSYVNERQPLIPASYSPNNHNYETIHPRI